MAKKTVTVTLKMSEIIYDIQNKTYLTGRSRGNGSNHEEVANMQANDDDENLNQILRSIGNAFSSLRTSISEYLDEDRSASDNILIRPEDDLYLTLLMPSNHEQTTTDYISDAAHQYIVNTAIAEWFTITNKADAADYATLATANILHISKAVNKRKRPARSSATE